jgi:hypothetical protein
MTAVHYIMSLQHSSKIGKRCAQKLLGDISKEYIYTYIPFHNKQKTQIFTQDIYIRRSSDHVFKEKSTHTR